MCSLAVTIGWKIHSLDIKSAFLHGDDIERAVHLVPPPEADTNKLWRLKRSVYGLVDAQRAWYNKLCDEVCKVGFIKSMYDSSLFFYKHEGTLQGVLCCHVDDCFFAGSNLFHETVITHIRNTFSLSKEHSLSFRYLGLEVQQIDDGIIIHQDSYIQSITGITADLSDSKTKLSTSSLRQFKGLIGQLQWRAKQTRPDISYDACVLSTKVKSASLRDIKKANKLLKSLQQIKVVVQISNTGDISSSSLILFSDASHGNLSAGGSQGGFIILLYGNHQSTPLTWRSRKLKRVVESAMGAETMALLEGAEYCMLLKALIKEITSFDIPLVCISDNKSLVDAMQSTSVIEDKHLCIDICALRQMLEK